MDVERLIYLDLMSEAKIKQRFTRCFVSYLPLQRIPEKGLTILTKEERDKKKEAEKLLAESTSEPVLSPTPIKMKAPSQSSEHSKAATSNIGNELQEDAEEANGGPAIFEELEP